MKINRTDDTVHVTLTAEEAEAARDDLGQIWASKVSNVGDKLHSLLESVTTDDVDDAVITPDPYSEIAVRGWTA